MTIWESAMADTIKAPRRRRGWLAALAVIALGVMAGPAWAAPAVQVWTGDTGSATPDLQLDGLTLLDTNGDTIASGGIAGTLNFTIDGTAYVGYCTDTSRIFSLDPEPVETTVQDPPVTASARALTWILLNRAPSGAPTPEKNQQAAISQVATWLLSDAQINQDTPTDDAALNTAAKALVQEALAATATPTSLALTAGTPAAGATSVTVSVTARAGATVTLAITSGTGTLAATQIVVGADGTGSTTLTTTGAGTVGVTASTAGDGRLIGINPTDPETRPQPTATAEPTTLTANVQVAFQVAPVPPAPTPPAPPVVVTRTPTPTVAITKTAPARAKVLSKVAYTITVRNTGKVTLRSVLLRDRLPRGLSFVGASRASRLANGNAIFRLGNIAPGQSRRIVVTLMANASVTGRRVNTATVSAANVRPRSARAATAFSPLVRRVQPAVTG